MDQALQAAVCAVAQLASEKFCLTMPSRSNIEMMVTRLVSLNMPIKVLTMPGMTSFSACGMTMKYIFCQ